MNKKIVDKIIEYLSVTDETSKLKISYYLESILGECEKFIILLSIFAIIGYGLEGGVVIGVMLLLRPYLGGTHFNSFWKCFIATMIMCVIPVILNDYTVSIYVFFCVASIVLLLMIFYAPVKSVFRIDYYGKTLINIRIKGVAMIILLVIACIIGRVTIRTLVTYTMIELIIDFVIAGSRNGFSSVYK